MTSTTRTKSMIKYKAIHKQLKQNCPMAILQDFSYQINSYKYLRLKIEKKFYNFELCETAFQALHVFFIFSPSSLLANSHILRSVR